MRLNEEPGKKPVTEAPGRLVASLCSVVGRTMDRVSARIDEEVYGPLNGLFEHDQVLGENGEKCEDPDGAITRLNKLFSDGVNTALFHAYLFMRGESKPTKNEAEVQEVEPGDDTLRLRDHVADKAQDCLMRLAPHSVLSKFFWGSEKRERE